MEAQIRKIIHVDMDAFYASVEQRDNPELRGKPVIVGGSPDSRGVVATCSYEARKFGIHSAMPSSRACRLCPEAIFVRARFDAYKEASSIIRDIFFEYTDLVEPLSLDEAYLDVTQNKKDMKSATYIAQRIKGEIKKRTRLTASAGVSFNKFLAKIASDIDKPDGLTVITPDKAQEFVDRLPIGKFFGVGKATEAKMHNFGIRTGADLKALSRERIQKLFGKPGLYYYNMARCNDYREVNPNRIRKSIGKERTFAEDLKDTVEMMNILKSLASRVTELLQKTDKSANTVTLKVKYDDFESVTRSVTLPKPINTYEGIVKHIPALISKTEAGKRKVRLLGVTVSNLVNNEDLDGGPVQLYFDFMYDQERS